MIILNNQTALKVYYTIIILNSQTILKHVLRHNHPKFPNSLQKCTLP